ncbi:xylR, partial [Symbiodinium pilosum]
MTRTAPQKASHYRVGLVLQTGQELMRGITRGVYQFARVNRGWQICGDGQYPLLNWDQVSDWRGDGLIAVVNSQQQLDTLLSASVPAVNAGSRIRHKRLPTVACDSHAIGSMAATHLLNCGLKNFLFLSELRWENERIRFESFKSTVTAAGHRCDALKLPVHEVVTTDASGHYQVEVESVAQALLGSRKPLGICTPNAELARTVVEVANDCGLEVPDEVAIIGVNDDPLICESTVPHISAVIQPAEQIGYQAAVRLDSIMQDRNPDMADCLLQPIGVAVRQSTDMLAIEDEDVREALKYIREYAQDPIDVADVLAHVAVSRRTLEAKFRATIQRTPALEIRRVRLERAKRLLAETNDPITNVVFACGFNSRQVFSTLFRNETGVTPSEFRRKFQPEVLR